MIQVQPERSPFAQDRCRCSRCGGLLTRYDFGFDDFGRTVEKCRVCGPALLTLRVGAPLGRTSRSFTPQMLQCSDCPRKVKWRGTGTRPARCQACQRKRENTRCLKRYYAGQSSRHRLAR